MKIYIKNMVCNRCKMVVKALLEDAGLHPEQVELGVVELRGNDFLAVKEEVNTRLQAVGFELLDDKKSQTIEQIKNLITDLVQHQDNKLEITLSEYLQRELYQDYSGLSSLFSAVEGITIEKYYILQKIEKVKELLVYDELTLSEIAFQLHYSSVAYLSNQFKKVTGLTPTRFKQLRSAGRRPLDEL
ncbi:MAG: helix-turn-helix transcriptional regulator [Lewinella sp.]|nr:helix-turn-helix transcriptional regulator [Lewinella sp.]